MGRELLTLTIPTGIGAEIGGYAGDCGFVAREFSKHFDLIVNPNVVNGGILSAINDNMHYVEGWALDEYLCGNLNLIPQRGNKIGVIFDCAIPKNILNIHINTINALKMVMGIDIIGYELTKKPVGVDFTIDGAVSTGNLSNPKTLITAGKTLIKKGAQALAVVCLFPEGDDELYSLGNGIDPIGGVEGIISHYLSKELFIPTAHSPAFTTLDISEKIENPKVCSEFISSTYLPCVLMGLNNSPRLSHKKENGQLPPSKGLIVPSTALGSKGVLGAIKNNIPIYAIQNPTQLNIGAKKLGIMPEKTFKNYTECLNYLAKNL